MSSKADYLKKYLSKPGDKKKHKKKHKKKKHGGLRIIDEDVGWGAPTGADDADMDDVIMAEEKGDSDGEPPAKARRTARLGSPGASSPRQRRLSSPDASPPRRRLDSPDASPPRRGRLDSPDASPPRRARLDSPDASPPRRRRLSSPDASPPRRGRLDSPDASPPRRRRLDSPDASPPRRRRLDSPDASPPRRPRTGSGAGSDSGAGAGAGSGSGAGVGKKKGAKMADGTSAGLQHAKSFKKEQMQLRRQEDAKLAHVDESMLGKGAQTVYRDKKGRKIDKAAEIRRQQEIAEGLDAKKQAEEYEWNVGRAQKRKRAEQIAEFVREAAKPLARSKDDKDLDQYYRSQIHEDDPMAAFMQAKKHGGKGKGKTGGGSTLRRRPRVCPNRFGIRAGYRWDGEDRGNGFEARLLLKRNDDVANKRLAQQMRAEGM